ncbi:MAG: glycosyltransferase [Candidatus Pacebacteria bacterium]|nr:glycosyltransferase [Candidatus Paceibacterota bacterium]
MDKKISIIIPTYNRAKQLKVCLESIYKQNYTENFELIVVDDGSKDDTKNIVYGFCGSDKRIVIKYIYEENKGCAFARNIGIDQAEGEYIFFTDDDCIVPENWIVQILEGFKKYPEASAVGGWYEVEKDILEKNKYLKAIDIQRKASFENYDSFEHVSSTNHKKNLCGNTANVCYKKDVFKKIGNFDVWTKKTARIDWEFKIRAHYSGLTLVYIPLIVKHNKIMTFYGFLHNAFRYGQADYYLSTRFKNYDAVVTPYKFFYLLELIKNKFPTNNLFYNFIFLFFQMLGAKFFKKKSVVVYEKKYENIDFSKRRNTTTNVEESCFYVNDYFFSNKKIKITNVVIEMLEKEYIKPLVSIVIPFYNRHEYVNNVFINSINGLFCSDSSVELILVDDGSTDNTLSTLNDSVSKFRFKTKVYTKKNGGPSSARNVGINNAEGEYIFFTDSDIIVPVFWIRELLTAFLYDSKISLVGGVQKNYKPKTIFDKWRNYKTFNSTPFFITNSLYWEHFLPTDTANMAIKNNQNLIFDEKYKILGFEDLDFVYNIKKLNKTVCYIPFTVSNIRSINKNDYLKMSKNRSVGYKIFISKNKDYHFGLNSYSLVLPFIKNKINFYKMLEFKENFDKISNLNS